MPNIVSSLNQTSGDGASQLSNVHGFFEHCIRTEAKSLDDQIIHRPYRRVGRDFTGAESRFGSFRSARSPLSRLSSCCEWFIHWLWDFGVLAQRQ
jgi:hypothetical protein